MQEVFISQCECGANDFALFVTTMYAADVLENGPLKPYKLVEAEVDGIYCRDCGAGYGQEAFKDGVLL